MDDEERIKVYSCSLLKRYFGPYVLEENLILRKGKKFPGKCNRKMKD